MSMASAIVLISTTTAVGDGRLVHLLVEGSAAVLEHDPRGNRAALRIARTVMATLIAVVMPVTSKVSIDAWRSTHSGSHHVEC
ncbi:MAG: hypothetical protein U1E49_08700 [Hyphomicrobiaceae bacterium]